MKYKLSKMLTAFAAYTFAIASSQAAVLVAGYDFQTTTTGGTAAVVSSVDNPSPLVYSASFGSATLYLDGNHGSSTFASGVTSPEVTSFAGTNINTSGTEFATATTGAASLGISNLSANGKRMVFVFSMTERADLSIRYATQATSTGFSLQTWSYSLDGDNFTEFDSFAPGGGGDSTVTFATNGVVALDVSDLSVLDHQGTVYIGVTFTGATNASGNNRLDNIQFTAVPEPTTGLLGGLGMLVLLRRRRSSF